MCNPKIVKHYVMFIKHCWTCVCQDLFSNSRPKTTREVGLSMGARRNFRRGRASPKRPYTWRIGGGGLGWASAYSFPPLPALLGLCACDVTFPTSLLLY